MRKDFALQNLHVVTQQPQQLLLSCGKLEAAEGEGGREKEGGRRNGRKGEIVREYKEEEGVERGEMVR